MRRAWLVGVVVALVALNVWRWWPAAAKAQADARARNVATAVQDLRLAARAPGDEALPRVERNIFELRQPTPAPVAKPRATPRPRPAPVVAPLAQTPAPPPKTPEEIEAEAAQAELAQIRLVGVIFRDGKPRAYFARGEQTYMVSQGDTVERFTVTAIAAESARLHDPRTQVGRVIPVLGK